jgi:iron complex transport system substrate-binding protein
MNRFLYRFTYLLCVGIVTFVIAFACSQSNYRNATSPYSLPCRVVQHSRGEACIPPQPKRIVTLDFNSLAVALPLDIKPVAIWVTTEIEDDFRYFKDKADEIEILRSPTGQINLEKLLLLQPDLIIVVSHPVFEGIYKQLTRIAPTIVLPYASIQANWKQRFLAAAKTLEKSEIANNVMNDYERRVKSLREILSRRERSIRASFAFVASGQLVIARKESFAGVILNDLGILNSLFETEGDTNFLADISISEESLAEIDSDIIFISPLRKDDRVFIKRLQKKPLWSKLKAVENKQVYVVDFSVWRGNNVLAAYEVLNDIEKYLVMPGKIY